VTVSPDQLQLKSQEQIDAERKAAEEAAQNGAAPVDEQAAEAPADGAESAEQLSADGAKAAGLAGQAASSETNALSEDQAENQPMPQSALPGTRPNRVNPALAAAVKRAQQQAGAKLGRNDLCWCGSGLKYKKCHGKDAD
jgi:preprotein translocase subunit SecA